MSLKQKSSGSTFKKVVVVRLDHDTESGYLDPVQLGRGETVDLLTIDGEHQSIPLTLLKTIHFVRDFDEPFEPARRSFLSRPRQAGLWVHLRFTDGDQIEGLVPNDLLGLLERGIQITPPDQNGNNLRLFIPRNALAEFRVLGVVGAAKLPAASKAPAAATQGDLFDSREK